MTELTDTQRGILAAASQHPDRLVLPLPERLKGGAARKVVASLLAKGLIEEVQARRVAFNQMLDDPLWRETGDGHGVTLIATDAAFAALGIAQDRNPAQAGRMAVAADDDSLLTGTPAEQGIVAAIVDDRERKASTKTRANSKQAQLIAMLRRPEGATIAEIATALEWQQHTIRGAIAGALKKKLGLDVTSEKIEGRRVYKIAG